MDERGPGGGGERDGWIDMEARRQGGRQPHKSALRIDTYKKVIGLVNAITSHV